MASSIFMISLLCNFLVLWSCFDGAIAQGGSDRPIVPGLSWSFYGVTCPNLETIVRNRLREVFNNDIGQAAGLLRLHFHDCFVQGCDGSVLLDATASETGEKIAPPNLSLRPQGFEIINDLRRRIDAECGRVVSCSDILTLAARDAVFLSGGPDYVVPVGRRDSLTSATVNSTLANLPPPSFNTSRLLASLDTKNFSATGVVALSGAHTVGIGRCTSFTARLYPTRDPTMDQTFARNLRITCPAANTTNTTVLDLRSPNIFDNKYYVDLMNRQGLFTSDQDLYTDSRTRAIVTAFAINQSLFFDEFVTAMIKMSQLSVLTGTAGEIRANCSVRNPASVLVTSVGEEKGALLSDF